MPFNTLTVGAAVTPSVIETYFSHYLNRAPLRQKPTAHISYHEGLRLIREFLDYSAKHSVEDLQDFTGTRVPAPHWVRINDAEVAPKFLERAARLLQAQLGNNGLEKIGGKTWWQWRRPESPLRAEWIEMKKEYHERKRTGAKCERVILYVHGGAYYFGSVDEHRYQMQRHARKLRARVLAPRYRLAPQFPFPCGLYDCLATYYYLLEHFDPSQVIFAGDSAGGGMVLSMLVTLRDQGQPLPAGTILLSPWVDLTHSFPSVAGDGVGDYIPPHGFHHKPSMAWPPPPDDGSKKPSGSYGAPTDAVELPSTPGLDMKQRKKLHPEDDDDAQSSRSAVPKSKPITALPTFGDNSTIMLDGKPVEMREQFQLYTTNDLLAFPLVSPVMQPSLGGLPPMLIQVGGAELLRDEQIYLAHKAANPKEYPPNDAIMAEYDPQRRILDKYPPTDVHLQVWEDLCHVPHTLSFTRPAKYMYRSVAQFAAWALAHAQHKAIDIQNDDAVSVISEDDDETRSIAESSKKEANGDNEQEASKAVAMGAVGKAGDPLPPFRDHMIRQRVTRHGVIYPLGPRSEMASLALDPASIGVIKQGPVKKWLAMRSMNEHRFANERKKIDKKRGKELALGYDVIPGERPPPTALVNRRRKGVAPEEKKKGKSWGLAMWSGWGSSHDEHTLQREQKTEKYAADAAEASRKASAAANGTNGEKAENGSLTVPDNGDQKKKRRTSSASMLSTQLPWARERDRPRSPYRQVTDTGQANDAASSRMMHGSGAVSQLSRRTSMTESMLTARPVSQAGNSPIPVEQERKPSRDHEAPIPTTLDISPNSEKIPGSDNTYLSPTSSRPHNGIQAYPFKLRDQASNPSIQTLESTPAGSSTPASHVHSELVGDAPKPVELPSAAESKDELEQLDPDAITTAMAMQDSESNEEPSAEPAAKISEEYAPPQPANEDASGEDAVTSEERRDRAVSPVEDFPEVTESSKSSSRPFKVRNTIFDPRTSMLGSIGPDGLPNAHHSFIRSDPKKNIPVSENEAPTSTPADAQAAATAPAPTPTPAPPVKKPGEATEATKAAPFKLRHTVYEPNVTLAKTVEEPSMPMPRANSQKEQNAADTATSPTSQTGSAGSSDKPPSYDSSMLPTNITMPETVSSRRPIVKPSAPTNDDGDVPPPPPPKDEKHLFNRRPTNKKAKDGNKDVKKAPADALTSKFSSTTTAAAPTIGDLSFEKSISGQEEKRPGLESFVTASEGRDLKGL